MGRFVLCLCLLSALGCGRSSFEALEPPPDNVEPTPEPPVPPDEPLRPGECFDDDDCGPLAFCDVSPFDERGLCVPLDGCDCASDDDCEPRSVCMGCACEPIPQAPPGAACGGDEECDTLGLDESRCVPRIDEDGNDSGFLGGYCTTFGCETEQDCRGLGHCVGLEVDGMPRNACLAACRPGDDNPCRPGYGCWRISRRFGICFPACTSNEDCFGGFCDRRTGGCDLGG